MDDLPGPGLARVLLLAMLAAALAGCGGPASRLYGTWKIDLPATVDHWGSAAGNELTKSIAKAAALSIGADATLELRKDDTALFTSKTWFGAAGEEGTWRVASAEGDQMQIEFRRKPTPQEEELWKQHPSRRPGPRKFDVKFLDKDTIEVRSATWQSNAVIFRRAP